jgi:hypothetical protein
LALAANTTYWVVVRPLSGQFEWAWTANNTGTGAGFQRTWGVSEDAGGFWWTQDIYPTQMRVVVDICPADFDGDGFVTGADFDGFVQAFEAGDMAADFDGDGFLTGIDFDEYVAAYESGC